MCPEIIRAPDASSVSAASRGPFYFAWGCFSDFVSWALRCTGEGSLHGVRDTRSLVLRTNGESISTPTHADLVLCRGLGRELREHRGDDRAVGAPGMAAADEERTFAGVFLVLQRIATIRLLAVGHGLVQRGHGGAEQFHQMRAGLEPADLAPYRFAPSGTDAFADQAVQDRLDVDAGRVGRRAHHRFRFADGHALVDREPQADVVDGIARFEFVAEAVSALRERLCVL